MTREDWSRHIQGNHRLLSSSKEWIESLVNEIYDDFESRNCGSCRYYEDSHCHSAEVDKMLDNSGYADSFPIVDEAFGCNKWYQKYD